MKGFVSKRSRVQVLSLKIYGSVCLDVGVCVCACACVPVIVLAFWSNEKANKYINQNK